MQKIITASIFIFLFSGALFAQNSFGFRAGMNFSTFSGDLEPGETYDIGTGFHIGLAMSRNFTDVWGIRGELVYTQKGTKIDFDGASYLTLKDRNDREITYQGTRKMTISSSNTYIDLPITGFGRIHPKLEISAGIVPGFLVNPTVTGDLSFASPELESDVAVQLDYNYYRDNAGEAIVPETVSTIETLTRKEVFIPQTIGAYYFQQEKQASYYNVFSLDAVFGASVFVNRGLFIGGRVQYGLLDVTNNDADFSLAENGVLRSDKDINIIYQASIGFNF